MNTDWQTKTIAPNGHLVQVDCNSGAERHIQHASCKCGQAMLIEFDAKYSNRHDRKRVFYADSPDNLNAFRCRGCHEPVSDCVPGANYEVRSNTN